MTAKQNVPAVPVDDWADYDGTGHAEVPQERWQFASLGVSTRDRVIYVGETELENPTEAHEMVVLEFRKSKWVEDTAGKKVRYNVRQATAGMIAGKVVYNFQAIVHFAGDFFILGSNSMTMNMFFDNAISGSYRRENFEAGIIPVLKKFVGAKSHELKQTVPMYAVKFNVKFGDKAMVVGDPSDKKKQSKIYPLAHNAPAGFKRVSNEVLANCRDFYVENELEEWRLTWDTLGDEGIVEDGNTASTYSDDNAATATATAPASADGAWDFDGKPDEDAVDVPF